MLLHKRQRLERLTLCLPIRPGTGKKQKNLPLKRPCAKLAYLARNSHLKNEQKLYYYKDLTLRLPFWPGTTVRIHNVYYIYGSADLREVVIFVYVYVYVNILCSIY